jgi:tetratricopeptide (TPR) repeat protein
MSMSSDQALPVKRPLSPFALVGLPLASLLLAACATGPVQPAPVVDTVIEKSPSPPLTPAANGQLHVLAGEIAAGRGESLVAAREFLQALDSVPDPDLAERATALAVAAHDDELAETVAKRWLALEPNSMDAREVIARGAIRSGDLDEEVRQGEEMIRGHAGGEDEGFRHVSLLLSQLPETRADAAVTVIQRLTDEWPQLAAGQHALGMVALRFDRLDIADRAAHKAIELQPKSREHPLLLVGVLIRQHKLEDSDALVEKLLHDEAHPVELRMGYAKLLLEANEREAARTQLQKVLHTKPDYTDAHFALGVLAFNDRDYEGAEKYLLPLLNSERARDAAFQLGRIEEARKHYQKALEYYARVNGGMQSLDAGVRRAVVLGRLGRIDDGREILQALRDEYPQLAVRFYLSEGEMLIELNHTDTALAVYGKALQQYAEDPDLLYGRSLALEKLNRVNEAETDLRGILKDNPDDARALNALGYMLTVHTDRLPEARQLVARALEIEPDDAAIMDSMGWVQFKLGNKEDARGLLQKAYDRFPDPEVAAHLGEVLWALGDRAGAHAVWDKGLAADPDHSVLKETVERLTR